MATNIQSELLDKAARISPDEILNPQALELGEIRAGTPVLVHLAAGNGVSGGWLRIAFMHTNMGRIDGPAWQMPIGAGDADGRE